jgi:hypothetical protein
MSASFASNRAQSDSDGAQGGAIYHDGCSLVISASSFDDHTAMGPNAQGGAIYSDDSSGHAPSLLLVGANVSSSTVTVVPSALKPGGSVSSHYGQGFGGGVYVLTDTNTSAPLEPSLVSLIGTLISGGVASNGGGVAVDGASVVNISASNFVGNAADPAAGSGGALYLGAGILTVPGTLRASISASAFSGNSAYQGAGLHLTSYASAALAASTFVNNSATFGAAVMLHNSSSNNAIASLPQLTLQSIVANANSAWLAGSFGCTGALRPPRAASAPLKHARAAQTHSPSSRLPHALTRAAASAETSPRAQPSSPAP